MSSGVWESNESPSTDDFDRTGVVAEIDGDIVMHIHEEKDRCSSVLMHRDNDRRHIGIHRDLHRCLEHWPVICNCSIDVRKQVRRLDLDSTSSARPIVRDTRRYASSMDRAGLEQVWSVRCVDHVDWFYRRELAASQDISPRDRRREWPNSRGLWESNRAVRWWPCSMVDGWAEEADRIREGLNWWMSLTRSANWTLESDEQGEVHRVEQVMDHRDRSEWDPRRIH